MLPYPEFQKQFYDQLLLSQYDPPEKRQQDQRRHLERLIRFARRNVPFYKDRLDVLFTSRDKIDWDKWKDVPITRRRDIIESGHLMVPEQLPPTHGQVFSEQTSGSTGEAITVKFSQYANVLNMAAVYRSYAWFQLDNTKDIVIWADNDPALATLGKPMIREGWGAPWSAPVPEGRTVKYSRNMGPEDMLAHLVQTAPVYLTCRTHPVHTVALEAMRRGITVPLLGVLTFGTGATHTQNRDIRAALGCDTIVPYSSKEGSTMAFQCPTGRHAHVMEETVVLEILDEGLEPVAEGQTGRIHVTPIFNFAMPLVRYDHGDMAVAGGRCSCGRTLGCIERIVGRTNDFFRLPNGRRISPTISPVIQSAFGAAYYQVAQIAPLHFEVRYVLRNGEKLGSSEAVAATLREQTHPEAVITFQQKADLERSASGKFAEFVCELPAESDHSSHEQVDVSGSQAV